MAGALFYINTIGTRISAGFGNPIVGFILGFQTKKYFFFMISLTREDPLWAGYWAPLTIGPWFGGVLAGLFFRY